MPDSISRIHVIACGVLAIDLRAMVPPPGLDLSLEFLPGGLHETPRELRRRLQEAIDQASARHAGDLIAIGYGVCGLGTVGIAARHVPLAIPRVHDCIALFLGSDAAYREQFRRYPGTYYISAGWVAEKAQPQSSCGARPDDDPEYQRLVEKYGREHADDIRYFLASWQRNYQRAAFIDTGAGEKKEHLADLARRMSEEFGWKYESLPGSRELLHKLLTQRFTNDEILIVPPHHVTAYDALTKGLKAVPVWAQDSARPRRRETLVLKGSPEAGADNTEAPALPASVRSRLGLGIDAGGTYTDVAIYDFGTEQVLQKAKALTTKWDFTVGIREALDQLDAAILPRVDLVALSTTLATNAIVEDRGQTVGLLIMPPYGLFDDDDIAHRPLAVLHGRLEIDGSVLAPVDPGDVRRAVRSMIDKHRVGAFAVCGYASHVNPSHELEVKRIIREECGLSVTCGHEVSEGVNYRVRAATAALNGRIIPNLEALIDHALTVLKQRHIQAPLMVVRSEGSLMNARTARERPIETILSGPAASVAGARHLSQLTEAIVVDIGGTTTDTAVIHGGLVRTCPEGASVGGHLTHVRALDMRTLGLGGDSRIHLAYRKLTIGPRRVAPLCWLAPRDARIDRALSWIEQHADRFESSTGGLEILALNPGAGFTAADARESRILDALSAGPLSLDELAQRTESLAWELLPLSRLEESHAVQRCGLTPTDVLHATGQVRLWDADVAARACRLFSRLMGLPPPEFHARVLDRVVQMLAVELLKMQLADDVDPDSLDASPAAMAMVENLLRGGGEGYSVHVRLHRPIVGIGAPVHFFLPQAAAILGTQSVVPPHADVANAVGAITSTVCIRLQAEICPNDAGRYAVSGLEGSPTFPELEAATRYAVDALRRRVLAQARRAGTDETTVELTTENRSAELSDGGEFFIGRRLEARLTGRPSLALLATDTPEDPPSVDQ